MISFSFIYTVASIIGLSSKDNLKYVYVFAFSLFLSFCYALLLPVGKDYSIYQSLFQGLDPVPVEIGFKAFSNLASTLDFSEDGAVGFVSVHIIILLGHFFFFRSFSDQPGIVIAIYILLPALYFAGMNLLRQHAAISLTLVALCLFVKGQRVPPAILMVAALLTHVSVVLLIATAWVCKFGGRTFLFLVAITFLTCILVIVIDPATILRAFLGNYAYFLLHESENSQLSAIALATAILIMGTYFFISDGDNYRSRLVFFCSVVYFFSMFLWFSSNTSNLFLRISALFLPLSIVAFGNTSLVSGVPGFIYRVLVVFTLTAIFWEKAINDPGLGFQD